MSIVFVKVNGLDPDIDNTGEASAEQVMAVPLALEVALLSINDSRLEITESGGDTQVVEIANFAAQGLNLDGRSVPVEATVSLAGDQPITIALKGKLMISQQTQVIGLETLDVTVTGALQVPVSISTSGEVDIQRQLADLKLVADISDTRAEGQLRYASFESPQIDTQLRLNQFTPALLALAGPEAAASGGTDAVPKDEEDVAIEEEIAEMENTKINKLPTGPLISKKKKKISEMLFFLRQFII